jgi:hypothetical protein
MGEQVANNTAVHCNVQLFENESGEYYPVTQETYKPALIRGSYIPMGNILQYPKKWGRKRGATELLEFKIAQQRLVLESAKLELDKLAACLDKVKEWPELE